MSDPNLAGALSQVVYDLLTISPHLPPDSRFTEDTWPVYCAGYAWALVMALRVIEKRASELARLERDAMAPARLAVERYFWRVMRWERIRGAQARERGAA